MTNSLNEVQLTVTADEFELIVVALADRVDHCLLDAKAAPEPLKAVFIKLADQAGTLAEKISGYVNIESNEV